jgi:hypothetical protein
MENTNLFKPNCYVLYRNFNCLLWKTEIYILVKYLVYSYIEPNLYFRLLTNFEKVCHFILFYIVLFCRHCIQCHSFATPCVSWCAVYNYVWSDQLILCYIQSNSRYNFVKGAEYFVSL